MKTYGGSRSIAPCILNPVSLMFQLLYLLIKHP